MTFVTHDAVRRAVRAPAFPMLPVGSDCFLQKVDGRRGTTLKFLAFSLAGHLYQLTCYFQTNVQVLIWKA